MYSTVWRFVVRPERAVEFERHYGPDGAWATLFRTAAGYVRTQLFRSTTTGNEYVTIDYWESEESYRAFRRDRAADYQRLDQEFESLTISEEHAGENRAL